MTTTESSWGRAVEMVEVLTAKRGFGYRSACQIGARCRVLIPGAIGAAIIRSAAVVRMKPDDFATAALISAILEAGGFADEELAKFGQTAEAEAAAATDRAARDQAEAAQRDRLAAAERVCTAAEARYREAFTARANAYSQLAAAERRATDLCNEQNRRRSGGWLGRFGGGKASGKDEGDLTAKLGDVQASIPRLMTERDEAEAEFRTALAEMHRLFEASQPAAVVQEFHEYNAAHGIENPRFDLNPIGLASSSFPLPL